MEFGVDLTIGPALEEGFYYDCFMGDRTLADAERPTIEKRMEAAVKEGQRFQRVVVSRDEALSMFTENKFKVPRDDKGGDRAVLRWLRLEALCSATRVHSRVPRHRPVRT